MNDKHLIVSSSSSHPNIFIIIRLKLSCLKKMSFLVLQAISHAKRLEETL